MLRRSRFFYKRMVLLATPTPTSTPMTSTYLGRLYHCRRQNPSGEPRGQNRQTPYARGGGGDEEVITARTTTTTTTQRHEREYPQEHRSGSEWWQGGPEEGVNAGCGLEVEANRIETHSSHAVIGCGQGPDERRCMNW